MFFRKIHRLRHEKNGKWMKRIQKIVLHHTAGQVPTNRREVLDILVSINIHHKNKDWGGGAIAPSITYHYAIEPNSGRIWQLNDDNDVTWHAGMANAHGLGVVVLGNFERYSLTTKQKAKIEEALDDLQKDFYGKYKITKKDWEPHSSFSDTLCCGKFLKELLDEWKIKKS